MLKLISLSFILTLVSLQVLAAPKKPRDNSQKAELNGELLISATEERAIRQLNKLIAKHKGTGLEAGLWFRLAELKIRRAKTGRYFEMNRDNDAVVHFAPAVTKNISSRKYIVEGVEIYDKIEKKFPDFRDMDVVLFNNAFARQEIGEGQISRKLYKRLIADFKDSALLPDAHLALGEMFYDEHNFKLALEQLNAIRNFPDSNVYSYGLYKAAWAYYNSQNTVAALKNLEETVVASKKADANGSPRLELRKEALSDMVLFFSELYPSGKAISYFKTQADKDEIGAILLKLSQLYSHHGKNSDMQVVLLDFIKSYPSAKEVPRAHYDLIENYETMKDRTTAVFEMGRLRDACAKLDQKSEDLTECNKLFNSSTSVLASKWHKIWLKDKQNVALGDNVEKTYRLYLDKNKNEEKSVKTLFSLSELLFQREKFRMASDSYFTVFQLSKDKKMQTDSVYSALVSLEKAVKEKWSDADEKRFIQIGDAYLGTNPGGPYAKEVRYKQAFIAYEKGRYDEAGRKFKILAMMNSTDTKTLKSQDLYLDILNIKKNYEEISQLSFAWMKATPDADRRVRLNKIYQESYFSKIQILEETGKNQAAIASYNAFLKENPQSTLADKALWNAIQLDYKIGDLSQGAASGHQFYKLFPQSTKAKDALMKAAQSYEFLGQLNLAADVLDDLVRADPKQVEKWTTVAADFRMLSGALDRAKVGYYKLINSKDPAIAMNAVRNLYVIEEKGNKKDYKKIQTLILDRGYEPMASDLRLVHLEQLLESQENKKAFHDAMELLNDKKASLRARAGARFIQAKILESELRDQSVSTTPDRVTMVLGLKTGKLDKVQRAYQEVVKMGDADYTIRSLRDLAFCYDHYVKSVRNIHFKQEMPAADLAMLNGELEKVTLPIEDKAVETLSQALSFAKKIGTRDGTISKLQLDLNKLNMRQVSSLQTDVNSPPMLVPYIVGGDS